MYPVYRRAPQKQTCHWNKCTTLQTEKQGLKPREAHLTTGAEAPTLAAGFFCQYLPAGQRVYALQAGVSCTSTTPLDVVGHHEQYVYCRLDQPNVFAATFDGAPFYCVGSRLGCHFVVQVETTNGR